LGIHETDPLADIHPSMWPSVNKSLYDLAMLEACRRRRRKKKKKRSCFRSAEDKEEGKALSGKSQPTYSFVAFSLKLLKSVYA
jgi:hypothetical protein